MSTPDPAHYPGRQTPRPLAPAFSPVPVRPRRDGWTADRQRTFIEALAETGCVVTAAREVGMAPRSAYRLARRADAGAFADAWDQAIGVAALRLRTLAFEYVTHGVTETVTGKDGEVVSERRRPSERLLIFLLTHLDGQRFGRDATVSPHYRVSRSAAQHRLALADRLDELEDVEGEDEDEDEADVAPEASD